MQVVGAMFALFHIGRFHSAPNVNLHIRLTRTASETLQCRKFEPRTSFAPPSRNSAQGVPTQPLITNLISSTQLVSGLRITACAFYTGTYLRLLFSYYRVGFQPWTSYSTLDYPVTIRSSFGWEGEVDAVFVHVTIDSLLTIHYTQQE
jgi:hypothetical protein